jgi:hypothetical protein
VTVTVKFDAIGVMALEFSSKMMSTRLIVPSASRMAELSGMP